MTRKKTPDWDRGNGWRRVKDEWQDFDKAENKTVSVKDLEDMWCPASGSIITVDVGHLREGLVFTLMVGPKEYSKPTLDGPTRKRKPTMYGTNLLSVAGIPKPGYELHSAGSTWQEKKSWSAAVKTLVNEIIPAYEENSEAVRMWSMV